MVTQARDIFPATLPTGLVLARIEALTSGPSDDAA